jgi:hypothetical protein
LLTAGLCSSPIDAVSTGSIPFTAHELFADEELGEVVGNVVEFIDAPRRDRYSVWEASVINLFF